MKREPLRDGPGRYIGDLRISVTDACNFRCQYCMPAEGLPWLERTEILTFEEIARLVSIFAAMGVSDVRLTGGGALVRRDFPPPAVSLLPAPPPRRARPGAARDRDAGRLSRGPSDQDQRSRDPRLHRGGGVAVPRTGPAHPLRCHLHRVHAARRRPGVDA